MEKPKVIVGLGSCGIAAGAGKVYDELLRIKEADNLDFELKKTSVFMVHNKMTLWGEGLG